MDPLGPTSVPHDPVHVSILAKQAHEKVFGDALSNSTNSGKGDVTSIRPSIHSSINPSIIIIK